MKVIILILSSCYLISLGGVTCVPNFFLDLPQICSDGPVTVLVKTPVTQHSPSYTAVSDLSAIFWPCPLPFGQALSDQ